LRPPDGRRFPMITEKPQKIESKQMNIVLNWGEEWKSLVFQEK
jgi:hypothetical protein